MSTEMNTQTRFKRAMDLTRESGVRMRVNVQKCCRGCVLPGDLGMTEAEAEVQPYGYFYGGQGMRVRWLNGEPLVQNRRPEALYINWGNGAGERIKASFEAAGFEVSWDGTDSDSISINIAEAI